MVGKKIPIDRFACTYLDTRIYTSASKVLHVSLHEKEWHNFAYILKSPLKASKKLMCGTLIPIATACKGRFCDLTYML